MWIPYGRHEIDDDDVQEVARVLRGDWLTTGPNVEAFEVALRGATQSSHVAVCANGTAALHLAGLSLGWNEKSVVVAPPLTFVASANAARYCGSRVVFSDISRRDLCLDPVRLEETIERLKTQGKKVDAVVTVHFAGQPSDMAALSELAQRYNFHLVEDACHALGATYDVGHHRYTVGSCAHSDLSVFSFHPVKHITTGEGGAVTARTSDLHNRVLRFRSHGIERAHEHFEHPDLSGPWYYEMQDLGFNYRLSDLQCALGASQLKKLARFNRRRAELSARYHARFEGTEVRTFPARSGTTHAQHLFVVHLDFSRLSRSELMNRLKVDGIGTQVHYIPVHWQPYYRRQPDCMVLPLSESEWFYNGALSLPLYPAMTDAQVDLVAERLLHHLRD